MHQDVQTLIDELQSTESQTLRRALVRSIFSLFEGSAYRAKQIAVEVAATLNARFSAGERALLLEEAYSLDDSGRAQVRAARISFLPNVRFAFYAFCKSFRANFELPVPGPGWQALQKALQMRDRLTHPKSASDMNVTDGDLSGVLDAYMWFSSNLILAMRAAVIGLEGVTGAKILHEFRLDDIERRHKKRSR